MRGQPTMAILAGTALFLCAASAQTTSSESAAPAPAVSAAQRARYDANGNGVLDPAELSALRADEAKAASAAVVRTDASPDDTVTLSPFEVRTEKDDGFSAANAGTATRLALEMKDVPAPYSVMTRELIDALGITNIQEATTWSTNGGSIVDGNGADVFNIPFLANIRGVGLSSGQQRNNYLSAGTQDSYALERYDFGRGPNAALFNVGANTALGGGQSATTKKARLDRDFETIALTGGSWDYYRATLDVNRRLSDRLALRANGVWFDRGGWRMNEFERTKGVTLSGTYLITPKTELRLEGTHDRTARNIPQVNLFDRVSGWDGVTTFRGPMTNAMRSTSATPGATSTAGVSQLLGSTGLTFSGEPQGVDRIGSPTYVYVPGSNLLMNYQFMPITRRADETNRTPILANGVLYSRNGSNDVLPFGNATSTRRPPLMLVTDNGGELDFRYQLNLPADRFNRAINGSAFRVPGKRFTNSVDAPILTQTMKDANFSLAHQVGDRLYFEIGGDYNKVHDKRTNPNALRDTRIDISQTLPNGAANPHYLQPYLESPFVWNNRFTDNRTLRANAAYRVDLGRWGNHVLNLAASESSRQRRDRNYVYSIATRPDGRTDVPNDPRFWQGGDYQIRFRYYWNEADRPYGESGLPTSAYHVNWTDGNAPVASTSALTPRWMLTGWENNREDFDNAVLTTSSKFFKDKFVLLTATRYDRFESRRRNRVEFGDLPTTWDGLTPVFKPEAPANWKDLTYIPRNASGVATSRVAIPAANRPRINPLGTPFATTAFVYNGATVGYTNGNNNGVQIPNPYFASDTFRNDFSVPVNDGNDLTGSYGFVYHVRPWVSVSANYATTYVPPPVDAYTLENVPAEPLTGEGYDIGLRFNLLQGRLALNTNYFNNREDHARIDPPGKGDINALFARNLASDESIDGRNQRGLPEIFGGDYESRKNVGYEFEMVGKLARGWRLTLNVGTGKVDSFNRYPLAKELYPVLSGSFRQVLEDAGGMLTGGTQPNGAPGIAVVNPAVTPAISAEQIGAVNNYNAIWNAYALILSDEPLPGAKRLTANAFTDYTVQSGRLKGLRIGVGAQMRGDNFVGYRTADTLPNPSFNPNAAISATNRPWIDDPNMGQQNRVFVKQPTIVTATLGYSLRLKNGWRFMDGKEVSFQLRIRNLLNNQQVVYQDEGVIARPPNGDFTQPHRVSVPTRIGSFTEPTSFLFTTTLKL